VSSAAPPPTSHPAALPAPPPGLVRALVGWLCLIVGVALFPTPVPLGALLVAFGLACLGPRNRHVRNGAAVVLRHSRRWARRGNPAAAFLLTATLALRHTLQRLRSRWGARA